MLGGRCRSFEDPVLGRRIDNGNHLVLGANRAALELLRRTGGIRRMRLIDPPAFDMADIATGRRWTERPGRTPLWLGGRARSLLPLLFPPAGATVAERLAGAPPALVEELIRPLCVAVMNTRIEEADAGLLAGVLRTLALGGRSSWRPVVATDGLGAAFVEPAAAVLRDAGVAIRTSAPVRALVREGRRVHAFGLRDGEVALYADDAVVLAVPLAAVPPLLPEVAPPEQHNPIVNLHLRLDPAPSSMPPFVGIVGGTVEWAFFRGEVASATVSAADPERLPVEGELAEIAWAEIAAAVPALRSAKPVRHRLLIERRATPAQTPAYQAWRRAFRPPPIANLALAGDWTETRLPATIEAAIRSGVRAAGAVSTASREPPR